jgi:hypothetical protein
MVARFQQIYCVQQTYRGFIAALSGEYWARLWPKLRSVGRKSRNLKKAEGAIFSGTNLLLPRV